jgi:hypothetical protein
MKRWIGRTLIWMLGALVVTYVGDWAIWRVRVATGGGMGTVSVSTMIVTPLKGNKEEYDWGGTGDVDCSKSLFPQAGSGACWWLKRHPLVDEK